MRIEADEMALELYGIGRAPVLRLGDFDPGVNVAGGSEVVSVTQRNTGRHWNIESYLQEGYKRKPPE